MTSSEPITLTYLTVDVFTSTRYLGNPLAVVLIPASLRPHLTQDVKQRIAREFNFSETVFLHTLDDEARDGLSVTSREIDIFTIEEELPFAGHPTVGTAYLVLNHLGWKHVDTLVTKAGPIAIRPLEGEGERVKATIPHAVHVHSQTLGGILGSGEVKPETETMIKASLSDDPYAIYPPTHYGPSGPYPFLLFGSLNEAEKRCIKFPKSWESPVASESGGTSKFKRCEEQVP
ncbi:hypothetical protein NEUTE1DRAFT_135397 [Neurospora tetrasperma FGSC 2508]|uniref:Diaminopimelate epimerase-like protein n=1 Tax=Neurospora tetrasperma (strain FGSC 2508 / ATCC MYA-4615 / P0657) TaxID=510951 RepID=F8MDG9_NEUT8|nr:uncharacterized protein NEUTE1DRAFT_135397 [Neurospora tetrasperma FGSC 2508]EGO61460.1 hypothetical protein NEUTE1DRAFT_135397 [Neurospora tetrasperma FGSC 2508]EGZ74509.1 Diaminopimelate epimerase-like protein [Neurospora tetrasperma FGSC 2509]